ncbi:MAG: methyltransferase [Dehalococcoidia bacterium]
MADTNPILELRKLSYGAINTQAIGVTAELGIADAIAAGHDTPQAVAQHLSLNLPATRRLMRFLAFLDVLDLADDVYRLTETGEMLRSDVTGSFNFMARLLSAKHSTAAYANISHSIRTGEPAFNDEFGMGMFEYVHDRADEREVLYSAFTGLSRGQAPVLAQAFDFHRFNQIVDVGGGYGYLLLEILKAHPEPIGVLYDLPNVISDAKQMIAQEGLSERCNAISGSFFEEVPEGADAYMMKWILHDWDDERSLRILNHCREAMVEDGTIIVIEMVVPDGPDYGLTLWADMNMMLIAEGLERTEVEWIELGRRAGLKIRSITPTSTSLSVIEFVRV